MSAAILPIFAGGLLETLTRALQTERADQWSTEAVEVAISLCQQARKAVRGIRQEQELLLSNGKEAKAFVAEVEPLTQTLGQGLALLSVPVEALNGLILSPQQAEFRSESQALLREAADLHGFLMAALAKAKSPSRPHDWQRIREKEEAYLRGETKPL